MGLEPTFGGFADLAVANSGALPHLALLRPKLHFLCKIVLYLVWLPVKDSNLGSLSQSQVSYQLDERATLSNFSKSTFA